MGQEQFTNNAETTLDGAIVAADLTLDVIDDTPFPTVAPFRILVEAEGVNTDEIMTVTAISGLTYTVTRASEPTAGAQIASDHGNGAVIKHVLTAAALAETNPVGWAGVAFPITYNSGAALTTALALAANGGTLIVPIALQAPMRLDDAAVRNTDTASARAWRWDLYVQDTNTTISSENTLRRVAQCASAESFTASAASIRFRGASATTYLPAGVYYLAIQNTHATNTFGVGTTAANVLNAGYNHARTKTTTNPNGATLDVVAVTWTASTAVIGVMIRGRVAGVAGIW